MNEDAKNEGRRRGVEALRGNRAYAGTPGLAYVEEYLSAAVRDLTDPCWVAEAINAGRIVACPRCHFLHLPQRPFPPDRTEKGRIESGEAMNACDVCASLPAASQMPVAATDFKAALEAAPYDVQDERYSRAETLFNLFMGGTNGADALLWAKMAEGRTQALSLAWAG